MTATPTHWVVRLNRRNRSLFFALTFLGLAPHLTAIQASASMWLLLALHLLVYPQLAYLWAKHSAESLRVEFRNLLLDGFLFGLWMAIWGFPLWISFTLSVCVLINVVIFEGVRAVWKPLLTILGGAVVGVVATGWSFRPDTNLWTSIVCMAGLALYLLACAHYAYQRGVSLRASRRQLGEQLAEITTLQARLEELARRDPLTGAYNRRYLDESLVRALEASGRIGQPLSLLLIDIDHFKRINDNHGHPAGDHMIRSLADLLMQRFSSAGEVVCRYGGEEFVLVLPGIDLNRAVRLADQLREEFAAAAIRFEGRHLYATLSIGVSGFPEHPAVASELVGHADQALYAAKLAGRNRVQASSDAQSPVPGPATSRLRHSANAAGSNH